MKAGTRYKTLHELPAYDATDDDCRLPAGREYDAAGFDRIVDVETGAAFRLPRLQAANPAWYFSSGFNFRQPEVLLQELAFETVRCNEGLQVDLLHGLALDACPRAAPTYSSFTAALSADKRIEMRDPQGSVVKGLKHGKRFCTYHVRRVAQPRAEGT
jgi:hypothetical protein